MKRKFLAAFATVAFLLAGVTAASAYTGPWEWDNNNQEYMILGDGNGWGLELGGTTRYCVYTGAGYSTMHRVLRDNGGQWIDWWIDQECTDGYIRVCIENRHGAWACSTYINYGWIRYNR